VEEAEIAGEDLYADDDGAFTADDEAAYNAFMQKGAPQGGLLSDLIAAKLQERRAAAAEGEEDAGPSGASELGDKMEAVYTDVGKLLSRCVRAVRQLRLSAALRLALAPLPALTHPTPRYTTGKLPKAFKIIPHLQNWEEVVFLTDPERWSPHATFAATRMFVSQLNTKQTQRFLNIVLLHKARCLACACWARMTAGSIKSLAGGVLTRLSAHAGPRRHPPEPAPALCAVSGRQEGGLQARRLLQGPRAAAAAGRRLHAARGSHLLIHPHARLHPRGPLLRGAHGVEGRFLLRSCERGRSSKVPVPFTPAPRPSLSAPPQALLRMADMPYSGVTSFFIKTLLDKRYSLPYRVIDALVDHFVAFRGEERALPVIWHLCLLTFVQRYKHEIRVEVRGRDLSGEVCVCAGPDCQRARRRRTSSVRCSRSRHTAT